jgi:hypothetical protein
VALNVGMDQGKEAMWFIKDILPKWQPEANSCFMHISIKLKGQTL